jgi:lipopolysaccharide export system protein LptA
LGKGHINTKEGNIGSTRKLVYNEKTGQFITTGRAALQDSTNQLEADEIVRIDSTENLIAKGSVNWIDTIQQTAIQCDSLFLDKVNNRAIAVGFHRQPIFKSFSDPADTLYLAADTLIAFQKDTISKQKNILAYHDVKVYRSDLQAVCDSLTYSEVDSIFTLYHHPIIWSDTSQFFADTIKILQEGSHIKRMYLLHNAMIINSEDLIYFNQIKGRIITADFDSSNLSNVDVFGNAEAVYYAIDDHRAYIGVNKIICSHILAKFGSNKVDRIYFFNQPNGTLHPMRSVDHNALKLKGFQWKFDGRPQARLFIDRQTQ